MESILYFPQPQPIDKNKAKLALEAEEQLIHLSGLNPYIDIHFFDVKLGHNGENHIHTMRAGDNNKINMVIVHGYGGSGITFYRIIKELSKVYRVFCIDLLGMGLSSRPKFTIDQAQDAIKFFIESIELWRQSIGLDRFHLVGHSLGGYIAACYALQYPSNVLKLSLISPAGISERSEHITPEELLKSMGFFRKMIFKTIAKLWNKKMTPHSVFKSLGFIGKKLLRIYVEKRFKRPEIETKFMYQYLESIFSMPESSEKCLHVLLKFPKATAIMPLEEELRKLALPCDFYYGDKDWMDWTGAHKLSESDNRLFNIFWIDNAGHHINMDNPTKLVDRIIDQSRDLINDKILVFQQLNYY